MDFLLVSLFARRLRLQIRTKLSRLFADEPLDIFLEAAQTADVGRELVESENTYALIVKGHSRIEDHICEGDYVVIKPQITCQNGEIVVAVHMQEGTSGSATLKRFYQEKEHDRIRLQPANTHLTPILFPKSVWDREWQVQGKVIAIFRHINNDPNLGMASSIQTPEMSEMETYLIPKLIICI